MIYQTELKKDDNINSEIVEIDDKKRTINSWYGKFHITENLELIDMETNEIIADGYNSCPEHYKNYKLEHYIFYATDIPVYESGINLYKIAYKIITKMKDFNMIKEKQQLNLTQEPILHVDATPDDEYVLRILRAYRHNCDCQWKSHTGDGPETEGPLLVMMNESNKKRALLLDAAITKLLDIRDN